MTGPEDEMNLEATAPHAEDDYYSGYDASDYDDEES